MVYLYKKGKYKNCKTQPLILLDLNYLKNIREVLEEIKHDKILKYIPVIVLRNFNDDSDIFKSYGPYAMLI